MREWEKKDESQVLSVSNRAGLFYLPRREGGCAIADKSIGEGFQNSKYNFILNRGSLNFDMKKFFFSVFRFSFNSC